MVTNIGQIKKYKETSYWIAEGMFGYNLMVSKDRFPGEMGLPIDEYDNTNTFSIGTSLSDLDEFNAGFDIPSKEWLKENFNLV